MDNYKIIKRLSSGMFGTTYLVEKDNEKFVIKRQKILSSQRKKDYKHGLWREIDVYNFINTLKKKDQIFFNIMHDYKIYGNCKHIQKRPFKVDKDNPFRKTLDKLDKSKYCCDILIDYINGITLHDYLIKNKVSKKQLYSFMTQLIKIVDILYRGGYSHNDIHPGNLMVIKTNEKSFKYKGKEIKFYGNQIVCIDYGEALHKKYKMKEDFYQDFKKDRKQFKFNELWHCLIDLFDNGAKLINDCKKKNKKLPWERKKNGFNERMYKIYKLHNDFWNKIVNKYSKIYKKHTIQILEDNYNKKDITIPFNKLNKDTKRLIECIAYEFIMEYPKLASQYAGWCSTEKMLLSKKEVQDYLKITKQNDLEKWCFRGLGI